MFWKIYTWFLAIFILLGIFLSISDSPTGLLLDFGILTFSILGLFMFTYHKAFLSRLFWKIWFFISILMEIWRLPSTIKEEGVVVGFIALIITIPLYIGLFIYGFRSREIWD